jgi:preprotein translocase subunit SecD
MFKLDQFVSTGIVMSFVSAFFSYHVMMKKLMKVKRKKEKQNV